MDPNNSVGIHSVYAMDPNNRGCGVFCDTYDPFSMMSMMIVLILKMMSIAMKMW